MSSILVEARSCSLCKPILQTIADTCAALGHRVTRWRGPISGPGVRYSRRLSRCDAAFIWNGAHPTLVSPIAELRRQGTQLAFVELGWHPQRGTCQIDRLGVNARASWTNEPLLTSGITTLPVRKQGDLLVALQLDEDTQVTELSPWFANMRELIGFLCQHSQLSVRVRPHPKAPADLELQRLTRELGGTWDDCPNFAAAMERARAVAILNSSVGIEALAQQMPVLCYGLANYRHEGAVYCLDNSPQATVTATAQLAEGECTLFAERSQAAYERVMSHQWRCEDIPECLPPLLAEMLLEAPAGSPQPRSLSIWANVQHWFRKWQTIA
jgi:hypothetical protein